VPESLERSAALRKSTRQIFNKEKNTNHICKYLSPESLLSTLTYFVCFSEHYHFEEACSWGGPLPDARLLQQARQIRHQSQDAQALTMQKKHPLAAKTADDLGKNEIEFKYQ